MHESDRYKNDKLITFKVPEGMDNEMMKLTNEKDYDNRSEFIRKAVEGLLKREA
jgi:Arc/MetJ-type ribon-helix-helix transcriptional regulator